MAKRRVTHVEKDENGVIQSLSGPSWSDLSVDEVIGDIGSETHQYYVQGPRGNQAGVHVVDGSHGPHLRTDPDGTSANNLDDLTSD